MKCCATCRKTLSESLFYKDKRSCDGLYSHCKECHGGYTKRYDSTPRGRIAKKKSVRKYHLSEKGKLARKRYWSSEKGRKKSKEYSNSPKRIEKRRMDWLSGKEPARLLTRRAINKGILEREPCEVCGTSKNIHAHHDDYSKPLKVRWLCVIHHNILHHG